MSNAKYRRQTGNHQAEQPQVLYKRAGKNIVDVTALIRSIQRTEGNPDCFRRSEKTSCNREECAWRSYCLQG